MNKKILFCFLTALVVLTFKTDSSYSIPTILKYDGNYWTPEKMKQAKPLKPKNIGFRTRSDVETTRNTTDSSSQSTKSMQHFQRKYDVNPDGSVVNVGQQVVPIQFPIGLLYVSKDDKSFTCTASLINTDNGNIAVTAAHCIYDLDTQSYYDNIMFFPGLDHGLIGPVGHIPAAQASVTYEYININKDEFDWGMIKFDFNVSGYSLKYFTGALGWQLQPGKDIQTTIRGYPFEGTLENCPNDVLTLCTWEGNTTTGNNYYYIRNTNIGDGASGAAFMTEYDPNLNLGLLYSNYAVYDSNKNSVGPVYDPAEFLELIAELTP